MWWEAGLYERAQISQEETKVKGRKGDTAAQFLLPPMESSSLLHPLWADSSEGLNTADGHLLVTEKYK